MTSRIAQFVILGLIVIALMQSGCQKSGLTGLVPAKGILKFNGQVLDGATVTFVPSGSGVSQRAASCITDASGEFSMGTLEPQDGVYPGEYQVIVMKKIDSTINTHEDIDAGKAPSKTGKDNIKYIVPKKYENPETSGLDVTIGSKGDESIVLEVVE
ncbi:carboxypeptidase-like regulatory domain-containing protein [Lacunimicrobium album]